MTNVWEKYIFWAGGFLFQAVWQSVDLSETIAYNPAK
jgi:hypothetical protein